MPDNSEIDSWRMQAAQEEALFSKQWKRAYDLAGPRLERSPMTYSEAFEEENTLSFPLLVHGHSQYAYTMHLLTEIYKDIDRLTIRWMNHIWARTNSLDPDRYLLNGEVIHEWRNVFHHILRELPGARLKGNHEFDLQLTGLRWAAKSNEWRQCLIQELRKDLLPEHVKVPKCLEEREILIQELFRNATTIQNEGPRRRRGFEIAEEQAPVSSDETLETFRAPRNMDKPPPGRIAKRVSSFFSKMSASNPAWRLLSSSQAVIALLTLSGCISGLCLGMAYSTRDPDSDATGSSLDDGFYTTFSQALLLLFSIYCSVVPIVRSGIDPAYRAWFRYLVAVSALTGLLSVVIYPYSWLASTTLGYVASVVQLTTTVQILEGLQQAVPKDALHDRHLGHSLPT